MKIIYLQLDGVVLYAGEALELDADRAVTQSGSLDFGTHSGNSALVVVPDVPADFAGRAYTWVDGVWSRTEAGEAAFQALLAQAKAAKNDEINAARLATNLTTFPYGGKEIACETLSRSDVDGTNGYVANAGALPPGWPGGWKATDNTYVPIGNVAAWKQFYAAMVGQGLVNFAHAQDLKTQLATAATLEEVAAITW